MFGAILGLFGIGGKFIHDTKGSIFDFERKSNAIQQGNNTYIDRHGKERSIYTNNIVWDVYDKDGYNVTIDSKTREILRQDQRYNFESKRKEAKEKAIRAGDELYSYQTRKRNKWGIPNTITEWRRTKDDKIAILKKGCLVTPIYNLELNNSDFNIKRNRENIYKYCREWYIERDTTKPSLEGIIKEADEYNITVFTNDIKYCLEKIEESIKSGGECRLNRFIHYDKKYCCAVWVDEKYHIV